MFFLRGKADPAQLPPKFKVPASPHHPSREILLAPTRDGLLIKSNAQTSACARVSWGINPLVTSEESPQATSEWHSAKFHGVLGILKLFHGSYLLAISSVSKVGDVLDPSHSVYAVKGVVVIPLEQSAAIATLDAYAARLGSSSPQKLGSNPTLASSDDDLPLLLEDGAPPDPPGKGLSQSSSFFKTPLASAGSNDAKSNARAFAARLSFWNIRRQSSIPPPAPLSEPSEASEAATLLESSTEEPVREALDDNAIMTSNNDSDLSAEEKSTQLEERILKETVRIFTHEMYFAYDFDITTSLQRKNSKLVEIARSDQLLHEVADSSSPTSPSDTLPQASQQSSTNPLAEPHPHLPLWRRVDRRFWWNEEMSSAFVEAGLHDFVLPVMQGYIQMASFPSPAGSPLTSLDPTIHSPEGQPVQQVDDDDDKVPDDIEYIIISRRSRQRAGLRYQRRGIDEDANVANFVETEAIVRAQRNERTNVFSYVQLRGSMPLFWSQPGTSLKPAPKLDRTLSESSHAMKAHFDKTIKIYGPHTSVNLAEQTGKEAAVTTAYRELMNEMGRKDAVYHEFDFHKECKGMKYENISILLNDMAKTFAHQGFFWVSGGDVMSKQDGVFRVNCIDCLDRTNVVESAFARHVLDQQLQAIALLMSTMERREIDTVFNDVWANNGDAVSRAYAGTSALKGDFTRTGKRDLAGMINDGMNSLARMYTATFSDFFAQAVIDFVLGHRSLSVFSEFMLKLTSTDPRELFRLSKIRAIAIETCTALVVIEGELVKGGWTLLSPTALGVRLGDMFEEKVLLLTSQAVYIISYDYTMDKVVRSTRVPLGNITGIQKGAYILSTVQEAGKDISQNYGFVISYQPLDQVTTRITSYSIKNRPTAEDEPLMTPPGSPAPTSSLASAFSLPSFPSRRRPASGSAASSTTKNPRQPVSSALSTVPNGQVIVEVAFKALPIDYAKEREGSNSFGLDATASAFMRRGATSKDHVEQLCETIERVCGDVGVNVKVLEKDVVSVAEAQKAMPVFASLEYALKRALWLGSA